MSDTELDGTSDGVAEREARAPDSTDAGGGPEPWRSVLIIVPLVAGVLVAAALGARMLLAEIPDPTAADGPADVTCWDHETVPAENCTTPAGRAGLRWVFPSFRPDDLDCRNVLRERPALKRPTMFECEGSVRAGEVTLTYSEFADVDQGRRSLEREYGSPPEEVDDAGVRRLVWTEGDEPNGDVYELDVMYAEVPFGVEVRARSAKARDLALESLVELRPEDQISVRP